MTNRRRLWDQDWFFSLEDREECVDNRYDFSTWQRVVLPHEWSREYGYDKQAASGPRGGFVKTGVGYYKKVLYRSAHELQKKVFIEFDGVYMNSHVYINGHLLGVRPYGYISFSYELTAYLVAGINIITVKVDDSQQESSRWYNGSGIHRHVWLRVTEAIYVEQWGTHITVPSIEDNIATVHIASDIVNATESKKQVTLTQTIINHKGEAIIQGKKTMSLEKGQNKAALSLTFPNPRLWSLENPYVYTCVTDIHDDHQILDTYETSFGVRQIDYQPNKGFFLNGKNLKLKGVCLHHDAGIVGAAVPDKIYRKRIQLLKDMGCNAIRTAHNPFPPVFYTLCDALGMMVMDEIFDGWETLKAAHDYGAYFEAWHEKDLRAFIKRDRNHPCVIMWSIGNEVTGMTVETNKKLQQIIQSMDVTRPITCGINAGSDISENNREVLEIAGYNDGGGACFLYDRDHESRPDQLFVATEAPHSSSTRGFYRTQTWWRDKNQARIEIENLSEEEIFFDGHLAFRSSYDNAGVRVGIRDSWTLTEERPYLIGEFRWTGIDYYGESYGWPARWSDSGVIGTENCPKDPYYLYQSMWCDEPMVHLLPHWTHPQMAIGTIIPVVVYTNCSEAELYLNGKSLGKKDKGIAKQLVWDVPYYPGLVAVVAYENGKVAAQKQYTTAGQPEKLKVTTDTNKLTFDETDVAQIDVRICDENLNIVPYGENTIYFTTYGHVQLLGTENGCTIDTTPLTSNKRKAFYSLCTGMVKGKKTFTDQDEGGVIVSAILGDVIFEDKTIIAVHVEAIDLGDKTGDHDDFRCYYRLNQNSLLDNHFLKEPMDYGEWQCYTTPITVEDTTYVEVKILKNSQEICHMTSIFTKGKRERVIDLTHGNTVVNTDKPLGPFAKVITGVWTDGYVRLAFKDSGDVLMQLSKETYQHVGYWWYDYPVDPFEGQDYAGVGEIWFNSGERNGFKLGSKEGKNIIIDNSQAAIKTAYHTPSEIVLGKVIHNEVIQ